MTRILFYQPDRYSRPGAHKADRYFEKNIPCKFNVVTDWGTFLNSVKDDYDLVAFHCDLFNNADIEIIDFIKTIQTILKLVNSTANIAVCINDKCTQETILQIRSYGAAGIIPGRKEWGLDVSCNAFKQCVDDEHWPAEIISTLPAKTQPSIAFFEPTNHNNIANLVNELTTVSYNSLERLSHALSLNLNYISLHVDIITDKLTASDFMLLLDTTVRHIGCDRPVVMIKFTKETNVSRIKEFQKAGINYFIPAGVSYGIDQLIKAIQEIVSGVIAYYPRHLISELPGNEKKKINASKMSLTSRQLEIFNLIAQRGLSNKQIARVLNISESTVKIHVSAIFKNLCVRNRTQLALTKISY